MDNEHRNPDDDGSMEEASLEEMQADLTRIKNYCQKLGEGIASAADLLRDMREQQAQMDLRLRKLEADAGN